ncbi:unnamed protein product, partial [Rotaria socialis]
MPTMSLFVTDMQTTGSATQASKMVKYNDHIIVSAVTQVGNRTIYEFL